MSNDATGGFAAGMLVHTRDGLKPIQNIKVGDYVLSKPETGNGESTYKRVIHTLELQNQEVWYLEYIAMGKTSKYAAQPGVEVLITTPTHLFRVLGTQSNTDAALCDYYDQPIWKSVEQLGEPESGEQVGNYEVVLLNNGDLAIISATESIKKTPTSGLGWHQAQYRGEPWEGDGHYVYFEVDKVRADITFKAQSHYNDDGLNALGDYENYLTTVYNLEIEDCHTYFVGEMGIWVHTTDCGANEVGDTKHLDSEIEGSS